jgi:hypothetical protein
MPKTLAPSWLMAVALGLVSAPLPAQNWFPPPRLPAAFPLTLGRTQVFTQSRGELGRPTDMTIRPDGSLCVSDFAFNRVSCFSEQGQLLFHSGRKGDGPGEFEVPYRVTSLPDNTLLVLDVGIQAITHLSARGKYLVRWPLPIMFRQVNKMIALPGKRLLLAGVSPSAGLSSDSAMHVFRFDSTLKHLSSFGPLPLAKDPEVLSYWGSGYPALIQGQLVYQRGIPYELLIYREPGRLDRVVKMNLPVSQSADYAITVTRDLSSTSVSSTNNLVIAAISPVPVTPSLLIGQRTAMKHGGTQSVWWDAIEYPSGRVLYSAKLPVSFPVVELAGVTPSGRALLGLALLRDEPLLVRIELAGPAR